MAKQFIVREDEKRDAWNDAEACVITLRQRGIKGVRISVEEYLDGWAVFAITE